jgi:UDP-glucose:(heptosyl)LPS alpha-1,3-glucosyltransferase
MNNTPVYIFIKYFSKYGGVENICFRFYNFLKNSGYTAKIICGENRTEINDENIVETGLIRPGRFLKAWSFNKRAQKYLKFIQAEGITFAFDKVYGCQIYRTGSASHLDYLLTSIKGFKHPLIKAFIRMCSPVNYYYIFLDRKIFKNKKTQTFIAISELVANEIKRRFSLNSERIAVIHNGVNKKNFNENVKQTFKDVLKKRLNIDEDKLIIGFSSTNFERKGLDRLITALMYLPDKYILFIAGGRNSGKYLKLAKTLNLEKRIFFLGKIENMPEFYASIDVLVHPSYYDTFGNVVAEALSMNIPVITTKNTGASELVMNGVNGYIIPNYNEKTIAQYITNVINIKGRVLSQYVMDDFEVFEKYLEVINKIV